MISLLVSEFQRPVWEFSVHICSCPCIKQPVEMILIRTFFHVAGSVIFETKVSALFWAVFLEEPSVETMSMLLPSAQYLYEELMLTPYMARYFTIINKVFYPYFIMHQFLGLLSCTNLIVHMPGVILSGSYV